MELESQDFTELRNFIYNRTGLFFEPKKIYFLQKQVTLRMRERNLEKPGEYLRLLKYRDHDNAEFQELVNLLTTNETYFFREFEQLAVFAEHCLQEVLARKAKTHDEQIRIWSAGCATGEEPYTLSIILLEKLRNYHKWNIEIMATDIDTVALEKAISGVYSSRSVENVPEEYMNNYFVSNGETFRVKSVVKKPVKFMHMNLIDKEMMHKMKNIDFIFCRNVLIYFDETSRRNVVNDFHESLNDNGFIFLGHSESLSGISSAFALRIKNGLLVYQKRANNSGEKRRELQSLHRNRSISCSKV